jgi:hypothetical protein
VIKLPVRQQQAAGSAPNGSGDRYNPDQQAQ